MSLRNLTVFLSFSEPVSSFSEKGDRTDSLEEGNFQLWAVSRTPALIPLWGLSDLALGFGAPLTKGLYPTPPPTTTDQRSGSQGLRGGVGRLSASLIFPPPHLPSASCSARSDSVFRRSSTSSIFKCSLLSPIMLVRSCENPHFLRSIRDLKHTEVKNVY